jgi:hypothetical protein
MLIVLVNMTRNFEYALEPNPNSKTQIFLFLDPSETKIFCVSLKSVKIAK